jgi:hypothetical protein
MTTDRIAIPHPVSVSVPYVSLVVFHDGWLQNIAVLTTKVTFCQWIVHMCQHVKFSFSFPDSCYQLWSTPAVLVRLLKSRMCILPLPVFKWFWCLWYSIGSYKVWLNIPRPTAGFKLKVIENAEKHSNHDLWYHISYCNLLYLWLIDALCCQKEHLFAEITINI